MTSRTVTTAQERPTPQWRPVARRVLIVLLQRASWFWFSAVIIVCGVLFTISRFTDVTLSGVQFVHQTALWFQFAMAISVVVVYLPVHVAAGTTRRSFIRGALIAAGTTAVGYTAVLILLLLVEGQIYGALGWSHGGDDQPSATVFALGVWPYLGGTILIFAAGTISGLLVGAAYYRWGGWQGTLALPLALAPLLLVSVLVRTSVNQWSPLGSPTGAGSSWQPQLGVALLILAAMALQLLVRRVPIR